MFVVELMYDEWELVLIAVVFVTAAERLLVYVLAAIGLTRKLSSVAFDMLDQDCFGILAQHQHIEF